MSWTRRKPVSSDWVTEVNLNRYDERNSHRLLLQDPPRTTRRPQSPPLVLSPPVVHADPSFGAPL